jgi:hypothetical protein
MFSSPSSPSAATVHYAHHHVSLTIAIATVIFCATIATTINIMMMMMIIHLHHHHHHSSYHHSFAALPNQESRLLMF